MIFRTGAAGLCACRNTSANQHATVRPGHGPDTDLLVSVAGMPVLNPMSGCLAHHGSHGLQNGSRRANAVRVTAIPSGIGCSALRPTSPEANAAGLGTPNKQDSRGIQRVQSDASGFPERSTQPMVGSKFQRSTCRRGMDEAARGSY